MNKNKPVIKKINAGVLTGAANGLFGGGGGMIAVPILKNMLGYSEKQSHATAILLIAPVSLAGAITYILGGYLRADIIIPASIGSIAGGMLGALALDKIPEIAVKIVFIATMLVAGLRMLF